MFIVSEEGARGMPTTEEKARARKVIEDLEDYSVAGVDVTWERTGYKGKIVRQGGVGPGALFLMELDKPIGFERHVRSFGLGEKEAQALYEQMLNDGCLDTEGMIRCAWTYWRELIVEPKKGVLTEYTEDDPEHPQSIINYPGRIAGIEGDIALLELYEPVSYFGAPGDMVAQKIRKGFYSEETYVLGVDLVEQWKEHSPSTLPRGRFTEEGIEYVLEKPIKVSDVRALCQKHFPFEPGCWWESLVLYVVPIDLMGSGSFRPMREDLADYYAGEYEVAYQIGRR